MGGEQRVAEDVQSTLQHAAEGAGSLTPPPQAFIAAAAASGRPLTQPQPPERSTAREGEQAQTAPRQTIARFLDQLKAQAGLQTVLEQAPAKLPDRTPPAQIQEVRSKNGSGREWGLSALHLPVAWLRPALSCSSNPLQPRINPVSTEGEASRVTDHARRCRRTDHLVLAMMLAFTLVLAFCVMAATLVDRQWIHVSNVCWYNPRTNQSLFYPYYGLHDSQQLSVGWRGFSYCDDTDDLFKACTMRFVNSHISAGLAAVGAISFILLALMGLWALGFLIYFTLLLGQDADYVLPACYHRRAYYHAYTNLNWLIGLVALVLWVATFLVVTIHVLECDFRNTYFDCGQGFAVAAVFVYLVIIPLVHCSLMRLEGPNADLNACHLGL